MVQSRLAKGLGVPRVTGRYNIVAVRKDGLSYVENSGLSKAAAEKLKQHILHGGARGSPLAEHASFLKKGGFTLIVKPRKRRKASGPSYWGRNLFNGGLCF